MYKSTQIYKYVTFVYVFLHTYRSTAPFRSDLLMEMFQMYIIYNSIDLSLLSQGFISVYIDYRA